MCQLASTKIASFVTFNGFTRSGATLREENDRVEKDLFTENDRVVNRQRFGRVGFIMARGGPLLRHGFPVSHTPYSDSGSIFDHVCSDDDGRCRYPSGRWLDHQTIARRLGKPDRVHSVRRLFSYRLGYETNIPPASQNLLI